MNKDEIFAFLNEYPEFFLATIDGGEPRVRAMRIYQANDGGIFFNTSREKDVYRQLLKYPSVEMCFFDGYCTQVRIRGKVLLVDEDEYIEEMCKKTPQMKPFIAEGKIAMFKLTDAKVKVWEMDSEYVPRVMSNIEMDSIWMSLHMGNL